ncbi:hypothetical protein J7U46_07520 [Pelomonas sp. V22]|uniref:hypothetical protein n=1 Tax=Pelomonas sp. V22 TaxID=2822139 RepID=UPI0024A91698|nr:hypothetical protein [Pelomonas sp. V22]MDI4632894.1 hypothetical protein [Pelomonas sp. V22]
MNLPHLRRLTAALALLLCTLSASVQADENTSLAHSPPVIGDRDLSVAKGLRRVAIASYAVQFVLAQTSNGGGVQVDFEPVLRNDPAQLQRMTEAMYADFQASVKAAGFELVPHDTVLATPEYRVMQQKSSATPLLMETGSPGSKSGAYKSAFHVPQGLVLNLKGDEYDNLKNGYTGFSQIVDDTLTFGGRLSQYTTNWPYYDNALQQALGAATLHVRVFVPIAYVWNSSSKVGTWTHYSSGAMAAVRLGERFTRLAVGHKSDIAKLYLTEDLMSRGITEARLVRETTNLFGKVTGREVDYQLNPQAYEQLIPAMAHEALQAMLARLKAVAE